jgi:hypothetical protein
MMAIDECYRGVEGGESDHVCIGGSSDLATSTRSEDPLDVYPKLGEVVQEVLEHFRRTGGKMPAPQKRSVMEVG